MNNNMNERRCGACESWVRYETHVDTRRDGITYEWSDGEIGWGRCERATTSRGGALDDTSLAVAEDGESYIAWLTTKPEFSCGMFTPRDEDSE